MQRRRLIAAGTVVVLAGAVWIAWRVAFRDTATPVSPAEVVQDVAPRPDPATTVATPAPTSATSSPQSDTSGTGDGETGFVVGRAPGEPGLYAYATTGFEEIDALGGARHDYPAETFLTIQPGGCGTLTRWVALEERWQESDLCDAADGLRLAGFDTYHEWFGRSDLQEFECDPDTAMVVPLEPSASWSYQCSTDERTETWSVEVIGLEMVDVGGEAVETLHVRVLSVLEGASEGTSTTDTWYWPGSSLIVREKVDRSNTSDSLIGAVAYVEQYEIVLESLLPRGT